MLELLKDELEKRNAFNTPIPSFLENLAKTIPNNRIHQKMKLTIAVSELVLFASEFRRNILHWNNSLIPINAITFIISGSGFGKDSSINAMRKNFASGYKQINEERKRLAIDRAKKEAVSKKQAKSSNEEVYMKFYKNPMPLFVSPSTNEGFIKYLNTLDEDGIGGGYIYSGEFGGEIATGNTIIANFQLLSELYDEGKKEVKVLKSEENQSKEIKNLPVSALYVSSPDNILFDEAVKKKFKVEFTSKLARRSFFNYNPENIPLPSYTSVKELLAEEIKAEDEAKQLKEMFNEASKNVAIGQLKKRKLPIRISSEARELMTLYQKYNIELSETIKKQYPISKIVRGHLHWKAFKLSGALALIKGKDEIEEIDYKEAMSFTELLDEDMTLFETELIKEPYELFVTLVHQIIEDSKCFINIHTLKKLGYIQGNSNISKKLKELATLAGSYDESGIYTANESGIEYSKIVKTNVLGISYLECKGSKEDRKRKCDKGYKFTEINFEALEDMLKGDYAYTPFEFKNGIRAKANILNGCKWIALDVDNSLFTDEQMHYILSEVNHYIARTSNKDNDKKFRVILELDSYVDLDDISYKKFIESIADYLSIEVDVVPKSQIYFSYSDRKIYKVTDKSPIEVREHLINAYENTSKRVSLDSYTTAQKKALINNPFETFHYAFEAKGGEGSISLIRCAKHAKDLGMSKEEVLNLMEEINNYWTYPMEERRFENTILNQIRNWRF